MPLGYGDGGARIPGPPGDDVAVLGQLGQQSGAFGQCRRAGEGDLFPGTDFHPGEEFAAKILGIVIGNLASQKIR